MAQGVCQVCDGEFGRIGSNLEQSKNTAVACQLQQQIMDLQAEHDGFLKRISRFWAIAVDEQPTVRRLCEVRLEIRLTEKMLSSGNYEGLAASVVEGMLIERKAELAALRGQLTICKWCNEQ
jgi:hypothetical protein